MSGRSLLPFLSVFPTDIAYLVAVILALLWWRHHPKVSAMVFAGSLMSLVATIVQTMMSMYYVRYSLAMSQLASLLLVIGITCNVLRAVGSGLLIGAAFTDRPMSGPPSRFEVLPPRPDAD